ncbi:MAG: hypothetical protein ACWGNI_00400 [Desulfobacterales bacterium]
MKLGDKILDNSTNTVWTISGLRNSIHSDPDKDPPDHITGQRIKDGITIEKDFFPSEISLGSPVK